MRVCVCVCVCVSHVPNMYSTRKRQNMVTVGHGAVRLQRFMVRQLILYESYLLYVYVVPESDRKRQQWVTEQLGGNFSWCFNFSRGWIVHKGERHVCVCVRARARVHVFV